MVDFFTGLQPLAPGETDPAQLAERVRELDASEAIDRVLVGYSSIWPHNHAMAPYMLAMTEKFSPIVAHRPGVMAPTAAARYFATLDVLAQGRLAINVVVGGADKDLHREGDHTPKSERYERAIEYLDLVRRTWTEPSSFDHQGRFYAAENVKLLTRPAQGQVPIFMGGESDAAVDFGARHADLYMLWGEPFSGTRERIARVRAAAEGYARQIEFSLSLRLFLGRTEDEAWAKARSVERQIAEAQGSHAFLRSSATDNSVGRQRALALTDEELHDTCFWTGLTKLLGGFANSQALVGTEEQILDTLGTYHDLGVGTFLVTTGAEAGWDPALEAFLLRAKKEL
ncbi:alkanesulfonate monooxygenase [Streptomyces sp. SAI-135]|uniref:LLM class flavin-dependent oxidoreductase n=1 Tax=unclassified Streptomyces TaxID=2593676 RepID=UPI002476636D|nr:MULTISPECIES: LLM class flavin-dependent oxidoreductase [unclassified Streptomyces]MDH6523341.1 alkanesulfonate monooxygenase [Streptomyces sp. SAI-090]MDH6554965.1 alkanesulfonate monooxygenase [Streptomyces sp. SAI-041]MDH6574231.1 alkanesulfonate monooxygenase [Streptomyces sp. SAI-117]MDH6613046.1 alkanesulfonate monooxygenase [Streptomyces sp. SAI-135]